ncbi:proton-conducting transporter transmembrane domain-containing protein [Cellulomonas phragmiteti]|uniref:NADH:quinone oxidoreductase/Mrp antiporter transmembrane domain-containing protein n=1 Tax=Cellulomonas phragmiteti TaxID=478780 RepID=A0ABQ4DMF2_9CELL|nr:proton-conducting transporter membrane subunit [Cellulomonas phragmiteti]GIG40523.1 hypothetical protein Cph01nite_22850 [Cellulomonas phragmiteti]
MTWLWAAAAALPVAWAVALAGAASGTGERRRTLRRRLLRTSLLSLAPALALAVLGPAAGPLDLPWAFLGVTAELDDVGRPLLLVAVVLYGAALAATADSRTHRKAVLGALLLVCFVGNATVLVAADAATFYLGYALMSIPAYGLVVHERTDAARRAGRAYLVLTLVSEMAVLAGVLLVVLAGGMRLADAPAAVAGSPHLGVTVGLLLLGFGIKAGLAPLHVWLPVAHPAAPPPASAVLSGAMIKAGLVGWLRFLPLGEVALPGWGTLLVVLALLGAFGVLVPGVLTADPKVALAYSSVSQMGFIGVLVGVALLEPTLAEACVLAAVVYAVHHGAAKGGLFLSVTVWRFHGRGRLRVPLLAGMALLALAVAGAPLGSGSVAKYAAKQALEPSTFDVVDLVATLPLVGTVSTLLLARAAVRLLPSTPADAWGVDASVLTWAVLVVGGTVATWALAGLWAPVVATPGLDPVTTWDATWPVLLGLALTALAVAASRRDLLPRALAHPDGTLVPAGDVLVPAERAAAAALRVADRAARATGRTRDRAAARARAVLARAPVGPVDRLEDLLSAWVPAGAAVLVVAGLVGLVLGGAP